LKKVITEKLVQDILKNREGKIKVQPGYDGEYGQLVLESDKQEKLTL
jgi:PHP family Zn ribbon phosphoesterase